jgi:peptide/nickel transport system ATP-binding protein
VTGPLLRVRDLVVAFDPAVPVVDGVSFDVPAGGTLGIVGESGSGKSVTALALLRLLPGRPDPIRSGRIEFDGTDLLSLPMGAMPDIRGRDIAMVFQEPMSSLNPVMTIGDQIAEAVMLHERLGRRACHARAVEMLALVGIPAPEQRAEAVPHQFSGGQRQRVMIAMALACRPRLLIADEPTTALDVTIQAQVLTLMKRLRDTLRMAIVIISHDFGVIAEVAEQVIVMYAGRVVESADIRSILRRPAHPYTRALLRSMPRMDDGQRRLFQIAGTVPAPGTLPAGCPFVTRCPDRVGICAERMPPMVALNDAQRAACWVTAPALT